MGADQSKWVACVSTPKIGGLGACSPRLFLVASETASGTSILSSMCITSACVI